MIKLINISRIINAKLVNMDISKQKKNLVFTANLIYMEVVPVINVDMIKMKMEKKQIILYANPADFMKKTIYIMILLNGKENFIVVNLIYLILAQFVNLDKFKKLKN